MSTDNLPDGWSRAKFGDVVRNCNDNSRDLDADGIDQVVGLDHLDPGSLRLARWDNLADLPDGTTFTRKFKPGQVLFGKRRAYQRKVAVADFDGVCSGDILVFEPADKRMLAEFLPYVVQSDGFFDHALGTSAGSLSPRTKWAELAKYEFALPPVDEQQQIVKLMTAADRGVGDGAQADLFLNLITALIHDRLFAEPDVAEFVPLSELLVAASAGLWGSEAGEDEVDCMVVRSTEFTNQGSLAPVAPAVRSVSSRAFDKLKLIEGDLLIERSGGTEDRPVGRVISWPGGPAAIPSNFVHVLRADNAVIPATVLKWTLWYLHRVGSTRQFQTASTNMRNLRIKAYLDQPIPVLRGEDALALHAQLDAADSARQLEIARLRAAKQARVGLLSRLMEVPGVH